MSSGILHKYELNVAMHDHFANMPGFMWAILNESPDYVPLDGEIGRLMTRGGSVRVVVDTTNSNARNK